MPRSPRTQAEPNDDPSQRGFFSRSRTRGPSDQSAKTSVIVPAASACSVHEAPTLNAPAPTESAVVLNVAEISKRDSSHMNARPVLTSRQFEVLVTIEKYVEARGWPPSITELCKEVSLARGPAVRHLETLERKGVIQRAEGSARALTILVPSSDVRVVDIMPIRKATTLCARCRREVG